MLHAAVYQHNLLSRAFVVAYYLLAAHLVHEVHALVVGLRDVIRLVVKKYLSHHHAVLAQHLGELAGVDARDSGHVLALQPVGKALGGIPVTVLLAVVGHYYCRRIDLVALHEGGDAVAPERERGDAVVSDQWIGESHQLAGV